MMNEPWAAKRLGKKNLQDGLLLDAPIVVVVVVDDVPHVASGPQRGGARMDQLCTQKKKKNKKFCFCLIFQG